MVCLSVPAKSTAARRGIAMGARHPSRHCGVIGRRAGIGGARQPLAEGQRGAAVGRQFGQHIGVILGIDHNRDKSVVLGRRADHRGAPMSMFSMQLS